MRLLLNRRQAMGLTLAGAACAYAGIPVAKAIAATEDVEASIAKFTGGAATAEGKINLSTPEIAENGNTVPIEVDVESEMTAENHVEAIMVLADGNPNPGVITFHFTPASGAAAAKTRIRLAKTQNVIAIAKMSDGSFHKASNEVKVTIGGCGG